MTAPPNAGPFQLREYEDEPVTLEDAVIQAVGAAASCWENVSQAGPFNAEKAEGIVEVLTAFVRHRVAELVSTGQPAFVGTLEDLVAAMSPMARTPLVPLPARVALYELP